jgi:hypothetical protein
LNIIDRTYKVKERDKDPSAMGSIMEPDLEKLRMSGYKLIVFIDFH